MQNKEKGFVTPIIITLIILLAAGFFYLYRQNNVKETNILLIPEDVPGDVTIEDDEFDTDDEMMEVTLFIQDKEYIDTSCAVTKSITVQLPKTQEIPDISLQFLFDTELLQYGFDYQSVSIVEGVAKILLASELMASGLPASSLSSCESSHLLSVLKDTLVQYDSVDSIELHSRQGEIQI